jgi:hypothetical protein
MQHDLNAIGSDEGRSLFRDALLATAGVWKNFTIELDKMDP